MPYYICATCGVQYPESSIPPEHCPICEDERQYIGANGQQWTVLAEVQKRFKNVVEPVESSLYRIKTEPKFGIGQQAFLVQTPQGNVLWDCITLIDESTIEQIQALGGIKAIALSHPHYFSTIVEWSAAFGNVPIYIHEDNREWVMRSTESIVFWQGETLPLWDGLTLIRCAGHFEGASVLHWQAGAEGRGVLLTGDTIDVVADTRYVSFMYSYPNLIPLSASKVQRIVKAVEPFNYDRIYEAFGLVVQKDAKANLHYSAERYLRALKD